MAKTVACFLILASAMGCRGMVNTISRQEDTAGRMLALYAEMAKYYEHNGRLPESLSTIPVDPNKPVVAIDAWGHAIEYRKIPNDGVVLFSGGRDGKAGGDGLDSDFTIRLEVIDGVLKKVGSKLPLKGYGVEGRIEEQ